MIDLLSFSATLSMPGILCLMCSCILHVQLQPQEKSTHKLLECLPVFSLDIKILPFA